MLRDLLDYSIGSIVGEESSKKVACIRLTRMGMIDSAVVTNNAVSELKPKVCVMTGICGGLSGRVELGDVIVASESWDWQRGKHTTSGTAETHSFEPDIIRMPDILSRKITGFLQEIKSLDSIRALQLDSPKREEVSFRVGAIASGSAVVSSSKKSIEIASQSRKLLGIDMEIFGFYSASRNFEGAGTTFIALKSVCDLADSNKNDDFHPFSSTISAEVGTEIARRILSSSGTD